MPEFKANVIRVEVKGGAGAPGKSAYQSYVDTTDDDPVLSEEAWSEPSSGGSAIEVDADGVGSFQDQNDVTRYFITYPTHPFP